MASFFQDIESQPEDYYNGSFIGEEEPITTVKDTSVSNNDPDGEKMHFDESFVGNTNTIGDDQKEDVVDDVDNDENGDPPSFIDPDEEEILASIRRDKLRAQQIAEQQYFVAQKEAAQLANQLRIAEEERRLADAKLVEERRIEMERIEQEKAENRFITKFNSKGRFFAFSILCSCFGIIFFHVAYATKQYTYTYRPYYYDDDYGRTQTITVNVAAKWSGIMGIISIWLLVIAVIAAVHYKFSIKFYRFTSIAMSALFIWSNLLLIGAGARFNVSGGYYKYHFSIDGYMAILSGLCWLGAAALMYMYVRSTTITNPIPSTNSIPSTEKWDYKIKNILSRG